MQPTWNLIGKKTLNRIMSDFFSVESSDVAKCDRSINR